MERTGPARVSHYSTGFAVMRGTPLPILMRNRPYKGNIQEEKINLASECLLHSSEDKRPPLDSNLIRSSASRDHCAFSHHARQDTLPRVAPDARRHDGAIVAGY